VNVVFGVMVDPRLTLEGHEQQPEHVESRHTGDARADQP
jgi:hypothetical protein